MLSGSAGSADHSTSLGRCSEWMESGTPDLYRHPVIHNTSSQSKWPHVAAKGFRHPKSIPPCVGGTRSLYGLSTMHFSKSAYTSPSRRMFQLPCKSRSRSTSGSISRLPTYSGSASIKILLSKTLALINVTLLDFG